MNKTLDNIVRALSENKIKTITVGGPLALGGTGIWYAINRASEGKTKEAIVCGILGLINAYVAGIETRRDFNYEVKKDLEISQVEEK